MLSEMETVCCTGHLQFTFRVSTFSSTLSFLRDDFPFSICGTVTLDNFKVSSSSKFYKALHSFFHSASYFVDISAGNFTLHWKSIKTITMSLVKTFNYELTNLKNSL